LDTNHSTELKVKQESFIYAWYKAVVCSHCVDMFTVYVRNVLH